MFESGLIPAIGVEEVVVVTEGDAEEVAEQVVMETTMEDDDSTGDMVTVGAMEEIDLDIKPSVPYKKEERYIETDDSGSYARRSMVYEREGVQASKGPPPESSDDTDTDDQSSVDEDSVNYTPRKLPKKREFAYRLQWRNKDMLEAMKCVEDKKLTLRGAAKKFLVPYSTLKDRVHGRVRHGTKPGVKTALSPEEEEELVRYIKDMEAAGFALRNYDVRERAGELLRLNYGHSSPYGEGSSPGHNWLAGFLKRHHGIEFKRVIARSVVPSCSRQKSLIKKFYEITNQVYKKNRIQTRPERMYAVSEMKVSVFQKATIIYAASASGSIVPPFVIFKGQHKLKLTSARDAFPQAFFTSSPSGQVTEELFLWWFRDHFLKVVPHSGNRPLVLFISQPCLNVSLQMYQLAKEERVIFISVPQGVTHLLQPLDYELGQYVESCLTKKASKWETENPGTLLTQRVHAQLLQKVWKKSMTVEEIQHKFTNVGIYPFNSSAITTDKILAMSHTMRENLRRSPSPQAELEDDDPLQGLSLLSALSSHEYATIGRSQENLHQDNDQTPRKRLLEDFETPPSRQSKRHKVEMKLEEDVHDVDELIHRDLGPVMDQVVNRVATERRKSKDPNKGDGDASSANKKRTEKNQLQHVDVHSEIALARENLDQINRAVDSILSSEPVSDSTAQPSTSSYTIAPSTQTRRSRKSEHTPRTDNIKVVKIKVPPPKNNQGKIYSIPNLPKTTGPNYIKASSAKKINVIPQVPQQEKLSSPRKIIFMLNKQGQLVSQSQETVVQAPVLKAAINRATMVDDAASALPSLPTLAEEQAVIDGTNSYANVKIEGQEQEEVVLEEPVLEESPEIYTTHSGEYVTTSEEYATNSGEYVTTSEEYVTNSGEYVTTSEEYVTNSGEYVTTGADIDDSFSIANRVEEQPPQHILQDEELDLDTVDTILIDGQLFRVIRAPRSSFSIKQEQEVIQDDGSQSHDMNSMHDVNSLNLIQSQEVNSLNLVQLEDGTVVTTDDFGGASVVHQEVVQDYEVSSFEQVQTDGVAITDGILEEQVM